MTAPSTKVDREHVKALVAVHGWDSGRIADMLGVNRNTICRIFTNDLGRPKGQRRGIDRARLERLTAEHGHDAEYIADLFGCHPDSIWRIWRDEYGFTRPNPHYHLSDEQMARLVVLAAEGFPSTWIAEDLGVPASVVRYRRPADAPFDLHEWNVAWQSIRRSDALLDWHYQIGPKAESQGMAERFLDAEPMGLAA